MFRLRSAWQISKKEFRSLFQSPIAYIVIVIFLAIQGSFFFVVQGFFLKNQAELRDFFGLLPVVLTFIVPAITMRLFAEEINTGSYEILATLPVSPQEIVVGKYLSAVYFISLMLAPTLFYPITISFIGDLHWGPVVGGYIGAVLLGATLAAVGIFASSLTRNQIVSFIVAVALCFALWLVDKILIFLPEMLLNVFQWIGTDYHFQSIAKGVIDFRDVLYFLSMSFIFVYATHITMREKVLT